MSAQRKRKLSPISQDMTVNCKIFRSQDDKPNILITGTPGVGKSSLAKKVAEASGLEWINIGQVAKDNGCLEEYDEQYECPVLDEDKLLDILEPKMKNQGYIVEYHSCEFFPERWFNAVFVLRSNTDILYDRLKERNYNRKKIEENVQCEIFQTILEEAKESYDENIVFEYQSNTEADLQDNCSKILDWLKEWKVSTNK